MTEKEPITVVDNRKIDPETGEVRTAGVDEQSAPDPAADGAATAAAPEAEVVEVEAESVADTSKAGMSAGDVSGELAERTADLQRLTAEYANYRRRVDRDRKAAVDAAKAAVVTELLGVLDDLDRARAHGDLESGPLKSVADKLVEALRKQGLEEFGTEGDAFDPTLHEAVQHEGSGHDQVLGTVMRKGYRFGERVLRHALVGVTDGVAGATAKVAPDGAGASDEDAANKD